MKVDKNQVALRVAVVEGATARLADLGRRSKFYKLTCLGFTAKH